MADLDRAQRVQTLLNDSDVVLALDQLEQSAYTAWRNAKTTEAREAEWHGLQALTKLRARLKACAAELKFDGR
jgi:hypothetical protein